MMIKYDKISVRQLPTTQKLNREIGPKGGGEWAAYDICPPHPAPKTNDAKSENFLTRVDPLVQTNIDVENPWFS